MGSLEKENELRHFLRVARPEWSLPKRKGTTCRSGNANLNRIVDKLKDVGIHDTEALAERIEKNTINDQFAKAGHGRFSREAIEGIRRHTYFVKTLDSADTPFVRQMGSFASVPQMLAKKRIVGTVSAGTSLQRAASAGATIVGTARSTMSGGSRSSKAMSSSSGLGFGERELAYDAGGELRLRGALDTKSARKQRTKRRRPLPTSEGLYPVSFVNTSSDDDWSYEEFNSSQPSPSYFGAEEPGSPASSKGRLPSLLPPSAEKKRSHELRRPKSISFSLGDTGDNDDTSDAGMGSSGDDAATTSPAVRSKSTKALSLQKDISSDTDTFTTGSSNAMAPSNQFNSGSNVSIGAATPKAAKTPKASEELKQWDQLPTIDEAKSLIKLGQTMRTQTYEPRWSANYWKSLEQQGQEMLQEQTALDEKYRFVRGVRGDDMRPKIARNIRARLREEQALRDNTMGLNIQQHCMNIRKNINTMVNARRELVTARQRLQALNGDENEEDKLKEDFAELGLGFRTIRNQNAEQTAAAESRQTDGRGSTVRESSKSRRSGPK